MACRVILGIGLVYRDNILIAIAVNIAHDQAIAATERETCYLRVINNVLLPAYVVAIA